MKYVILKFDIGGVTRVHPFIFADIDVHSVVAAHMKSMILHEYKKEASVHSAGFCGPSGKNEWWCYPGSSSLGIEERHVRSTEDERILSLVDSTCGILL